MIPDPRADVWSEDQDYVTHCLILVAAPSPKIGDATTFVDREIAGELDLGQFLPVRAMRYLSHERKTLD